MAVPTSYPFPRYLSAKKTVDDRALNKTVWASLTEALGNMVCKDSVRVLEIGAGIGTMVERALEWDLLCRAEYTALDAMPDNIATAASRLPQWAREQGYDVRQLDAHDTQLVRGAQDVRVHLEAADLFDYMNRSSGTGTWDLLIANAFLDLVDVPATLPQLFARLKPGGLFYFTITFDGGTMLEPSIEPELDARIEALYHRTMDERIIGGKPSGDSRTGRHFFRHVRDTGANLIAAGPSDWVVFAGPDGYPADEQFFLHFIVHTIGSALAGHPELDGKAFTEWVQTRHQQVEDGTLVYIAHQLDFLGRVGE
jgi:SAM-dependent methyltransferase